MGELPTGIGASNRPTRFVDVGRKSGEGLTRIGGSVNLRKTVGWAERRKRKGVQPD